MKHWTERMFVENPTLFEKSLEKAVERASIEVKGLEEIFSKFGVTKNSLILDLCCGIGRHSVILAEKSYNVVGLDLSPKYIKHANKKAIESNVTKRTNFKIGDMRLVGNLLKNYKGKFNVVLNLYTSLGYYNEETDRNILNQLYENTALNCILIIEMANRDFPIRHFLKEDITYPSDNLVLFQQRKLNFASSRMENVWKYYQKKGKDLIHLDTFELDHRIYSFHELKNLVEKCSWTFQTCYSNLNLDPFIIDSNRIVLVAQK